MRVIGMIPARYGAARLPGKALADICGKPMVVWVYERCKRAVCLDEVLVATDDERIKLAVEEAGGRVEMTRADHPSGTDRLAEVASRVECDLVVNIQGDEPLIEPQVIEQATAPLLQDSEIGMGTVASEIHDMEEYLSPTVTKVVVDGNHFALYFSKTPVPFYRMDEAESKGNTPPWEQLGAPLPLKHLGLYVYRRETLLWLSGLEPTPLEQAEKLEQLRALENGCRIKVALTQYSPVSVDTPADLERVRALMAASLPGEGG